MAYVEWHQEIWSHYKTHDLMKRLQIPKYQALGIIGAISSWGIGNRPGGIIERKLIEIAVEWDRDPKILVQALVDSGWLDKFDDDRVEVHDWEDITAGYRKARKDAARKRKERTDREKPTKKQKKASSERRAPVRGRKRAKNVHGLSTERRAEQNEQNEQNERTNKRGVPATTADTHSSVSGGPGGAPEGGGNGTAVAVPEKTGPKSPVLGTLKHQVSIRRATPLLEALQLDPEIARTLAGAHPAYRILAVVQAARQGKDNPAGWARRALDEGWSVPEPDGPEAEVLLRELEADRGDADRILDQAAARASPRAPRPRLPGETDEQYLRRGLEERRREVTK
ncbi:MAG: hypothetical protein ACRD1X_12460 [Vicinamibacteria bacterium]